MPVAVTMPKLGMSMREGTVVEWRARPGDRVEKGQVLLVIESEKAEADVEATAPGVLRQIYVQPGETVPSGTPLAALTGTPDEPFDAEAFRGQQTPAQAGRAAPEVPPGGREAAAPEPGREAERRAAPVTPAARRLARRLGVDPERVPGSGPGGRVRREDIEVYAAALERRVRVAEGVALEVADEGEGPQVLLLPGFGSDHTVWARQVPALAGCYRVRAVCPRGVGLSDAPEAGSYDVAILGEDAGAVAGEPAHVVGASLGAAAAIELALRRPERVRSLTLITPVVEAPARLLAVLESWVELSNAVSENPLARALLPWLFSSAFLEDPVRRARAVRSFAQSARRVPPATLARWLAGLRAWSGSRRDDLERISAPALVIGAGEDLLAPDAAGVAEALRGAALRVVAGAGHAVALEAADAVNAALAEHLAAADARRTERAR